MRTSHDRLHQITSCEGRRGEEERDEGVFLNVGWKEGRKVERTRAHRENFCVFFIFSLIKLDVGKFLSYKSIFSEKWKY